MKKLFFFIIIATTFAFTSDKPAYLLYDNTGKTVSYEDMINKLKTADIVFYGELHNNAIAHWLELEITKDLFAAKKENLVMGAEMFESDNQLIMNEYFEGKMKQKSFEDEMRLWPNYPTDYKPLLEFANTNKLPFIATNIPRRYAALVAKKGFEGLNDLSPEAKKYIAPLPINYDENVDCYKDMMNMKGMPAHMTVNFPKAQAIKDATMAYFILQNWKSGKLFLHYNGSYHSDRHQGIVWHLMTQNPKLKVLTVTTVSQEDINKISDETKKLADFIVVVPDDMTSTY